MIKPGFYNTGMQMPDGTWDTHGFDLNFARQEEFCYLWHTTIYLYRADLAHPLTFVDPSGVQYRPNHTYETDLGTVPWIFRVFVDKDRYVGYLLHDADCRFCGLYVSRDDGATWNFEARTRAQADELLAIMVSHDPHPGSIVSAYGIWAGVRIGSIFHVGCAGDLRKRKEK